MTRFFARWKAKRAYIWRLETQGATSEISAKLAQNRAKEKRVLIETLNLEAELIERNIKAESEKLEVGYWECENGHETEANPVQRKTTGAGQELCRCGKPMKLVKLSEMTGKEKSELERERNDAEKIVESKRQQAKQEAVDVEEGEKTVKHFMSEAANSRLVADKIRAI